MNDIDHLEDLDAAPGSKGPDPEPFRLNLDLLGLTREEREQLRIVNDGSRPIEDRMAAAIQAVEGTYATVNVTLPMEEIHLSRDQFDPSALSEETREVADKLRFDLNSLTRVGDRDKTQLGIWQGHSRASRRLLWVTEVIQDAGLYFASSYIAVKGGGPSRN